ncbi:glycerophosphodiester phosphodiesterase family protein [Mycoplasma zalophi]|uniref:glycerophosphodiester phosphodiesterase family protein n=1 Tax=Mycoplasma zalophi TaxID=191287 RepID=UPI001C0F4701|nr:glycerophosphodiester phosphodiesterase family protein [Mycoplasma zalophi]MBU4690921.1 hypothetical protein [Mycoplasma zalophi]
MKSRITSNHWVMTYNISHRGFHNEKYPENSISAFENAMKNNFAIELDIHILKDKNIVVFHDDSLKRMTSLEKNIEDCTYEELNLLNLNNTTEKIPLFKDVLNKVNGSVPLMIEYKKRDLKNYDLEKESWELLKNYQGEFVIQSFNPYVLLWFKNNHPEVIRGQLSGGFVNEKMNFIKKSFLKNMKMNKKTEPDFINYQKEFLDSKVIKKLQSKLPILTWTIRNKKEYQEFKNKSSNTIFENFDPRDL